MKRTLMATAGALAVAITLTACGGSSDPLGGGAPAGEPAAADTIKVGSANFSENVLLAEIYAQGLAANGVRVERSLNLGSRETYFLGLQDGSIDLIPDYSGNLLQHIDKSATATTSQDVYAQLQQKLPPNLTVLEQSAAQNKDAVVVTQQTAQQYNARSIADLAPNCGQIVFGGPPEFQTRPYGLPGIERLYGCTFTEFRSLDAGGPLTVKALEDGTVGAADLFTTDATIAQKGWVVLEDPQNNFAAQNVVPLINEAKASDTVRQALDAVSAKLTTQGLTELNAKLAAPDKPNADVVAKEWLTANGLL